MGYKQKSPIPIREGGTNSVSFAYDHGVVVYEGSQQISIDPLTSGYVLTSNGGLLPPSFQPAATSGMPWTNVTGATQSLATNRGYINNGSGAPTVFTLPATAAVGDIIAIQGANAGLWQIAQNAGQSIHFNELDSTLGVTGSVTATSRYDSITLLCITADTDFVVYGLTGNLDVI